MYDSKEGRSLLVARSTDRASTIKPDHLWVTLRLRGGITAAMVEKRLIRGVASNYPASLKRNDTLRISVRRSTTATKTCAFRLPPNTSLPFIMIGAGIGLAPFRGFSQERAKTHELNKETKPGPTHLFIDCRLATEARFYAEEMDRWEKVGVVGLKYAFSRESEKADGCKYVPDWIYKDQDWITELWEVGARVYLCGGRELSDSVEEAFMRTIEEYFTKEDGSKEMLEKEKKWFAEDFKQRAARDISD